MRQNSRLLGGNHDRSDQLVRAAPRRAALAGALGVGGGIAMVAGSEDAATAAAVPQTTLDVVSKGDRRFTSLTLKLGGVYVASYQSARTSPLVSRSTWCTSTTAA